MTKILLNKKYWRAKFSSVSTVNLRNANKHLLFRVMLSTRYCGHYLICTATSISQMAIKRKTSAHVLTTNKEWGIPQCKPQTRILMAFCNTRDNFFFSIQEHQVDSATKDLRWRLCFHYNLKITETRILSAKFLKCLMITFWQFMNWENENNNSANSF